DLHGMKAMSTHWTRRRNTIKPVKMLKATCVLLLAIFGMAAGMHARAQIKTVGDGSWWSAKAPHLEVALVAPSWFITRAGYGQLWSGVYFELEPGWHVYWVN